MTYGFWTTAAAWVEAIGAIAAVVGAAWVAAGDARAARRREERALAEAERREQQSILANRTAALNLAILAATQINDLHVRLRDEAWRGRMMRVSPSRSILTVERMLTAFPIQSLGDAGAMVAFSRVPAALATAAEVYANLEHAVRAAPTEEHAAIFDQYDRQMERLDAQAVARLKDLAGALGLELDDPAREVAAEAAAEELPAVVEAPKAVNEG